MKNRILYGWNLRRALYLVGGIMIIIYAMVAKEWWGALLGGYFAAMGLFNFGCASGNCGYVPSSRRMRFPDGQIPEKVEYEEVKTS